MAQRRRGLQEASKRLPTEEFGAGRNVHGVDLRLVCGLPAIVKNLRKQRMPRQQSDSACVSGMDGRMTDWMKATGIDLALSTYQQGLLAPKGLGEQLLRFLGGRFESRGELRARCLEHHQGHQLGHVRGLRQCDPEDHNILLSEPSFILQFGHARAQLPRCWLKTDLCAPRSG